MPDEIISINENVVAQEKMTQLFQKITENSLATEENLEKREEYRDMSEKMTSECREEYPEVELCVYLTGSVQAGLASESSDIDTITLAFSKDGSTLQEALGERYNQFKEEYTPEEQKEVYDLHKIKELLNENFIDASSADYANFTEEPNFMYWYKGEQNAMDFLANQVQGAERKWGKLYPIAMAFSPTTSEQEGREAVHTVRKEILNSIAERPDSEVFWEMVQLSWAQEVVWYEKNEVGGKDRRGKVNEAINTKYTERFGEEPDPNSEKYQRYMELVESSREHTFLPEFDEMLSMYGITKE